MKSPKSPLLRRIARMGSMFLLLATAIAFEASLQSCATRGNPDGGPRDTLAPKLDTSYPPNQSLHFKSREIRLVFNEFLTLKSPNDQIRITPLQREKPEITARSKEVKIVLKDSLKTNTTYIISFGTSLSDFTEGNVNDKFKYVFSTGDFIDSLYLSGSLRDGYSGEPDKEMLVGLYQLRDTLRRDSFLYRTLPDYYAYLDEEGRFAMSYLKAGHYLLVAFEDKDGDFMLTSGAERMAYHSDTLHLHPDTVHTVQLRSFAPQASFRFFNARQVGPGQVSLNFRQKPDSFRVEVVNYPADSGFFVPGASGDTLHFWYSAPRDSLVFKLNYDSLFIDSLVTVRLRKMKEKPLKITTQQKDIRAQDTIFWRANLPITALYPDSILRLTAKDTGTVKVFMDSTNRFRLYYPPPHKSSMAFGFKEGALASGSVRLADSTGNNFNFRAGEDLGSLEFTVVADSSTRYILEFRNDKDKLLQKRSFVGKTVLHIRNALPGSFKAYLIRDENADGEWTTGDFAADRQPEPRIAYREKMEIRANWEIELEWRVEKF